MGLDFIMKVPGCRAGQYPLRTEHITLRCAYSDTTAVTSCSRRSQYVKSWIATNWIKFSLSLVPAILHLFCIGIRQEVEQIRANVFFIQRFQTLKNFFSRTFLPARRYTSAGRPNSDRNVSVRQSVRPSVRLSRAGIVSKRRKLAAWLLHRLIAPRL